MDQQASVRSLRGVRDHRRDYIVVGAGLAGACAAAWLREQGNVVVIEADAPASGASGAAAGLINPFPGMRASAAWRYREALEALSDTLSLVGAEDLFDRRGIVRPARDPDQAVVFAQSAGQAPGELEWLDSGAAAERWPQVSAPYGALFVRQGGSVDLPAIISALLEGSEVIDDRVIRAGASPDGAWIETAGGERFDGSHVILATGDGFRHIESLERLPLGRLKGQTLRLRPAVSLNDLPIVAGNGYVVPGHDGTVVAGSTYEHHFADVLPSDDGIREILSKARGMVPGLIDPEVLEARAGIRVTVPVSVSPRRLPIVGPLRGRERVHVFTGLGSKGLLTAPLIGRHLADFLEDPRTIPDEVRLRIEAPATT